MPTLAERLAAQQVEGDVAQHREVLGRVARPAPGSRPRGRPRRAPSAAGSRSPSGRAPPPAIARASPAGCSGSSGSPASTSPSSRRSPATAATLRSPGQAPVRVQPGQHLRVVGRPAAPQLEPAVVLRRPSRVACGRWPADVRSAAHRRTGGPTSSCRRRLVVLERQHVVGPARARSCAAISFWQPMASIVTIAPCQVQQLQQRGDGGDLVGLVVDGDLAQDQAACAGPGADQVQRRRWPSARSWERRSVLPSMATTCSLSRRRAAARDPAEEAQLEGGRVEARRRRGRRCRGRGCRWAGPGRCASTPPCAGRRPRRRPRCRRRRSPRRGRWYDVEQLVALGALDARIGQRGEVVAQSATRQPLVQAGPPAEISHRSTPLRCCQGVSPSSRFEMRLPCPIEPGGYPVSVACRILAGRWGTYA